MQIYKFLPNKSHTISRKSLILPTFRSIFSFYGETIVLSITANTISKIHPFMVELSSSVYISLDDLPIVVDASVAEIWPPATHQLRTLQVYVDDGCLGGCPA